MRKESGSVASSAPLSGVLDEISERLVADDWMRCATKDGDSFYYIVGAKAHFDEQEQGAAYMALTVPRGGPVSALGEQQVHKQVAAPKSSDYYVAQALSRLASLGGNVELFKRFAEGDLDDLSALKGHIGRPGDEKFAAFSNLLQAMLLAKGLEPEGTEAQKRSEMADAVQKLYLRELSQLYHKVVQRAASLEPLDFSDPQLNEASRCYLYGFFRAAVVLSASALETTLRDGIAQQGLNRMNELGRSEAGGKKGFFNLLVDEADRQGLLGPRIRPGEEAQMVVYSREIFSRRTRVVHKGDAPTAADAEELVIKTREVIEHVRTQGARPT